MDLSWLIIFLNKSTMTISTKNEESSCNVSRKSELSKYLNFQSNPNAFYEDQNVKIILIKIEIIVKILLTSYLTFSKLKFFLKF